MSSKASDHLGIIKIQDSYGTPKKYFDMGCKIFKMKPKIDYSASDLIHVLPRYYTIEDDALTKEWTEDGWGNWAYSKVNEFMGYAWKMHEKYNINMLMLVYNKSDTNWWHDWVRSKINEYGYKRVEIYEIKGRIRFLDSDGNLTKNAAPYPSVFIAYKRQSKIRLLYYRIKKWIKNKKQKKNTDSESSMQTDSQTVEESD